MPITASKRSKGKCLTTLADFSLGPAIGIACFRLSPWAYSLASQAADLSFIARTMQVLVLIILLVINQRIAYKEQSLLRALRVAVYITIVGTVLILFGPSDIFKTIGSSLNGGASAAMLLGWGYYTCSIDSKKMVISITLGYVLYGIITWLAPVDMLLGARILALCCPILSYICLHVAIMQIGSTVAPDTSFTKDSLRSLPWGIIALLTVCAVFSVLAKLLIHSSSGNASSFKFIRFIIYFAVFAIYCIWLFVLKRNDQERLWPIYGLIVLSGLICFMSFSSSNLEFALSILRATQDCLMLFCWIVAADTAQKLNFPRIFFFGYAILIFVEPPLFIAGLLSTFFSEAGVARVDILAFVVPAAMLIALVVLTILLIASNPSSKVSKQETKTPAEPEPTSGISNKAIESLSAKYALSKRESEIALYLVRGYTLAQTAEALCLSLNTVRSHVSSLYRKLNIHKKKQLIEAVEIETSEPESSSPA